MRRKSNDIVPAAGVSSDECKLPSIGVDSLGSCAEKCSEAMLSKVLWQKH